MTTPQTTAPAQPRNPFAGVARLRLRDRVSTVDELMVVVAAVLLPLGLVMVFLGWYGASHTPYLFEQVPYLVSGGLLGLGMAMTGGFVLFGAWIARTSRLQRAQNDELLEAVRGVREELSRLSLPAPAAISVPPTQRGRRKSAGAAVSSNGSGPSLEGLVATARGSMLHRPDCAIVSDRDDLRQISAADAERLQPCRLCNPLGADAPAHA